MTRIVSILLTLALALSLGGSALAEGKMENVVFAFPVFSMAEGIQLVEDEINKITEGKINVHVTLAPISFADYTNQIGLMQAGGDKLDVFAFLGSFSQMVSKHQLMPLDDYVDKYAAEGKAYIGDDFLKATTVDGTLYAFPTLNGKAAVLNIVFATDVLEDNNISISGLKVAGTFEEYVENLDELSNIFAQIKAAEPDKVCLVPSNTGTLTFTDLVPGLDNLTDGYGVLLAGNSDTVVDYYSSDEYRTLLEYAHDWYNKGYILQDAATITEAGNSYISSGRTTGYFITGEEGQAEQITTGTGVDVVSIKIMEPIITTGQVNGTGFGISSTSKVPEAAMKFMNEMYSNPDIVNLLDWGVEGVHYVLNDDGTVDFPEGVDANNTTYGLNLDWLFGNQFLGRIWGEGRDTTIYDRLDANNKNALRSPALGFSYDSTKVKNQLTALTNVFNEYTPGLNTGTLDPATELEKFIQALKSAGIDEVIAEKQSQYDQWKEATQP